MRPLGFGVGCASQKNGDTATLKGTESHCELITTTHLLQPSQLYVGFLLTPATLDILNIIPAVLTLTGFGAKTATRFICLILLHSAACVLDSPQTAALPSTV